jgi:hypothetical protein
VKPRTWVVCAVLLATAVSESAAQSVPVTVPPESFFERVREKDRDAAHKFYKKYVDVKGIAAAASADVADLALQRTHEIVTHMLAGRPAHELGGAGSSLPGFPRQRSPRTRLPGAIAVRQPRTEHRRCLAVCSLRPHLPPTPA